MIGFGSPVMNDPGGDMGWVEEKKKSYMYVYIREGVAPPSPTEQQKGIERERRGKAGFSNPSIPKVM